VYKVNKVIMAINTTILTVITVIGQAIVALFSYFLAVHNTNNDKNKKREEKIDSAKNDIDTACDKGTISDLIDATKKLGDSHK